MTQISDLKSECPFNRTDIFNLLQQVRTIALKNQNKRIDFDSDSFISDADYYNLLGLSRGSFDDICSHITDIRNTKNRSLRTCIGIYLTKLRSGMSNRLLSTVFNIGIDSIKRSIWSTRKALAKEFTSNYIGFEHITRKAVVEKHTTDLAKTLFGGPTDPVILIIDGTYIFTFKRAHSFHFNADLSVCTKRGH
ncbi:unnamed protein product [Mytilus coruscus]|uniref:Transposase Helix-turn-helix domain-containing protein n=1 Tax=Mytilus coruscus TaxID=42192 RepID=A0A6J8CG66_MYTCO|nr:unnamed protein product [Mytilus coruscus]